MDKYEELKRIIDESHHIVVFSGAGISTSSGIPDFRSSNGIYNERLKINYRPEEVISHSFFMSHPEDFYDFYKDKMMYLDAKPNLAHIYFAELEKSKKVEIVTQNIDGLHTLAGSTRVYEIHGSIHRNYCMKCHKFFDAKNVKNSKGKIPLCDNCGGIVKPDVVLYEEPLNEDSITNSIKAIATCDTLIVIGTSLVVYPAASFVRYFNGKNLILINKSTTELDSNCTLVFHEDINDVINKIR